MRSSTSWCWIQIPPLGRAGLHHELALHPAAAWISSIPTLKLLPDSRKPLDVLGPIREAVLEMKDLLPKRRHAVGQRWCQVVVDEEPQAANRSWSSNATACST